MSVHLLCLGLQFNIIGQGATFMTLPCCLYCSSSSVKFEFRDGELSAVLFLFKILLVVVVGVCVCVCVPVCMFPCEAAKIQRFCEEI